MHVVYLLENISKRDLPRFYIGSKKECDLVEIRGIPTLVNKISRRSYFGSSQDKRMKRDLLAGHIFSAYILEECTRREDVLEAEERWLSELDVANSEYYYNLSAVTDYSNYQPPNPLQVVNIFGETSKKVAQSRSSMSKKNGTAKSLGFKDSYDLSVHIATRLLSGESGSSISEDFGRHRHFAKIYVKNINLSNLLDKDPSDFISKANDIDVENASYEKSAELLGIESVAVFRSLSYVDRFDLQTAKKIGLTNDDLDIKIAREILKGKSYKQISKDIGIDSRTVSKYFIRFFKRRFKISDLK